MTNAMTLNLSIFYIWKEVYLVDLLQGLLNSEIGVLDLIVMLLQQRIEHVSSVYTCNTYSA